MAAPTPNSEKFLNRLATTEDGRYLDLVKLSGFAVPDDVELYFCKNNFIVIQVRILHAVGGVIHDYAVGVADIKPQGGVYVMRDRNSGHEIQLKTQPPLGILDLIKPPPYQTPAEVDGILQRLHSLAGLFYVLYAFQKDPTLEKVPLYAQAPTAPRFVGRLTNDTECLQDFCKKVPSFLLIGEMKTLAMKLADCTRPKSRGILLKALMEVKMVLVIAVEHFEKDDGQFSGMQLQTFHNLIIEIHEDVLKGGCLAQYESPDKTWTALKATVVGPGDVIVTKSADDNKAVETMKDAWTILQDAVLNLKNGVIPRLYQKRKSLDLELPSTDFTSASGGAQFRRRYNAIWKRAVEVYLYDLVHSSQYPKGPEAGLQMIRIQWTRCDQALKFLSPSVDLDKAIEESKAELEPLLAEKAAQRLKGIGKDGINLNPGNSTGLVNPGDNLCASNALLQMLFSTEPFRAAILDAPISAEIASSTSAPAQQASSDVSMSAEAEQFVICAKRVFAEMAHPDRATASGKEVAATLYGKELGTQQDADELLHRLAVMLQDGLKALPNRPFDAVSKSFRESFVGTTYEMRLRTEDDSFAPSYPETEAAANKEFLAIPIQQRNKTLSEALEDFGAWASTGGSEVAWTQERLRIVPPFLCFASRQVSAFEFEDSLDLSRYATIPELAVQRDCFERQKALQFHSDLSEALEHLTPAKACLARATKANRCCGKGLDAEVDHVAKVLAELESRMAPLEEQLAELEQKVSSSSIEPPLETFLAGLDTSVLECITGTLGVDSVRKLVALVEAGSEKPGAALEPLVEAKQLSAAARDSILERCQTRQRELKPYRYDVHAIILYIGLGQFGHYLAFVRQEDGKFLSFDDEQVREHADSTAVRNEIQARANMGYPASVRLVVYRRNGSLAPLELPGPPAATNGAKRNGHAEPGGEEKRQKTSLTLTIETSR